ncbi:uncharacterized protein [Paramormyrops kingsleyae]|uniref:uncharacterized protein n=1 Tax=Paramormyrops kingsleyae TaxID=1676925 RepID=UPI003B97665C
MVIAASVLFFLVTIIFNGLAGSGRGPFSQSTGNVSAQYDTEITPAGWTFSIWGVIYAWLSAMLIYILTGFCRRTSYDWMYCSPAVLPYAFFLSCMLNMSLNVTWLFLWDREQMIAAVIVLALIAFTSYLMILFSCHVLYLYGAWLHLQHPADLWLVRVLVQNGIGLYATWTTVATLLNFTVALQHNAGVSKYDAATVALVQLLVEVILCLRGLPSWGLWCDRVQLERPAIMGTLANLVLETHLRYLLIIYPVVILALIGSLTKDYDVVSPSRNNIFTAALLAFACVLFIVRIGLVVRDIKSSPFTKLI